ncbi:MAG: ATP-binding protein [Sulfolobales archaeon]|nr:ATP-binding protein [Sulfolobales archaeon]MCX8209144.1 ATP-binding protein [Sulfolobales archaeon]MDW8010310.1 ATP-binding protein [Sulfolobales archaeon]
MSLRVVGIVGEKSTPTEVEIKATHSIPSGTYIYIRFRARDPVRDSEELREVVGIVGSTICRSIVSVFATPNLSRADSDLANKLENYSSDLKRENYVVAAIVADITNNSVELPKYPPPPETPVYLASSEHLRRVYRWESRSGVKVGSLVGFSDLDVYVNVSALTKHLLIAGTTGSGKSNLVAVLADRVAQIGGSVVVFDVHGEYVGLKPESSRVEVVEYGAAINPNEVPVGQLAHMIVQESTAYEQRRLLKNALSSLASDIREKILEDKLPLREAIKKLYEESTAREFTKDLSPEGIYKELLMEYVSKRAKPLEGTTPSWQQKARLSARRKEVVDAVLEKVESFFRWRRVDLEVPRISDVVKCGRIVVVNASNLSDEDRDYVLSAIADDVLSSLRARKAPPTLLVVEEAHIFLGRKRETLSKKALQRFIREGRKFGGMLAIVSQRPRALDTDVVSQVQNFAFLRLVQEADRSAVMEVTDVLGDEYSSIFPTLPPGHGIFVGEWVNWYPAYVRIDLHRGKRVGAAPNVVEVWRGIVDSGRSVAEDIELLERESEGA